MSLGSHDATKIPLRQRLRGWPARLRIDKKTLPANDREFLTRLARDTWRGIDAFTDREHALPLDNIAFGENSVDPAKARIGDYTNITNVGLYLVATVAAHALGFIDEAQAIASLTQTLATLEKLESYKGFFYNYYDTTTLERTSNFISFVDSSWLTAGLMVVRTAFPALDARCSRLIEQGDYGFFYDDVQQQMSHGYYVNLPSYAEYHYGLLYTESRLGSLIAIGKGDAPEEHWFRMLRTPPREYLWQSQGPRGQVLKTVHGHAFQGGYYEWRGMRYVPSWGGSMFEALMPTLVLDEQGYAAKNLGRNALAHVAVQQRYAQEVLGYPVWGLSPSTTPDSHGYGEYGVKSLGSRGYKPGAVTPHAAALALGVTPKAAIANLRELATRYDMYGDYGLYDAVDPLTGQVAHKYLFLDQAMLFLALANHLSDHAVQKCFAADPIAQKALPLIAAEDFFP
jgi:hypothetical protein